MVDLEDLDASYIIGGKPHQAEGILGWRGDPNFRNEVSKNREKSLNQFRSKGNAKSNKMLIVIMLIIAGIIYVQFML